MHLRQAYHRDAHATRGDRFRREFRSGTGVRVVGVEVVFGRGLTWYRGPHPGARGDDQGSVGAGERVAERLDGPPVRFADFLEPREVVDKAAVDHAV